MPSSEEAERPQLPGFGLPANTMPDFWYKGSHHENTVSLLRYPNAISDWSGDPMTIRERNMMAMVDKPEWKVFDEEIGAKWRTEAIMEAGQGFSGKMFEFLRISCHIKIPLVVL